MKKLAQPRLGALYDAVSLLRTASECERFFADLCTPGELASMADRWHTARLLAQGVPYRSIYSRTGVSTATVTRVARALTHGDGGYELILTRQRKKRRHA